MKGKTYGFLQTKGNMESKLILSEANLKFGIREKRKQNYSKLGIVKWVYDHSDLGLKQSKELVDNT